MHNKPVGLLISFRSLSLGRTPRVRKVPYINFSLLCLFFVFSVNPTSCLSSYLVGGELMTPKPPPETKPFIALIAMVVRREDGSRKAEGGSQTKETSEDGSYRPGRVEEFDNNLKFMNDLVVRFKREVDAQAEKTVGSSWKERLMKVNPWRTLRRSVLFSDSIQLAVGVDGCSGLHGKSALRSSTRLSQLWKDLLILEKDTSKVYAAAERSRLRRTRVVRSVCRGPLTSPCLGRPHSSGIASAVTGEVRTPVEDPSYIGYIEGGSEPLFVSHISHKDLLLFVLLKL